MTRFLVFQNCDNYTDCDPEIESSSFEKTVLKIWTEFPDKKPQNQNHLHNGNGEGTDMGERKVPRILPTPSGRLP